MGSVLIAEGDPFSLRLLEELCEEAGFDVMTADDGASALAVIARQRPALIVLDADLTTDDGLGVLEVILSEPALATIPVLLTTGPDDDEARRRGLEMGAADFVSRPYRVYEVEQRIRNLLRLAAAERAAQRVRDSLVTDPEDGTDPLTHAGGPAQLRISLDYEATRAVRYGHPLTCIVLRVVNLNEIVSGSGDEAGQGLLLQLANNLRGAIRGIDHLFRSDSDEFTILLPETTRDAAQAVLKRLHVRHGAGELTGTAIEPRPQLAIGNASMEAGTKITEGEALRQAARNAFAPLGKE